MTERIVLNTARVFAFVSERVPLQPVGGMQGIGFERDGELIAGVLYEGYNPHNVWMHVAAKPGSLWAKRKFLDFVFAYPFRQLGVDRVSGYVNASNQEARRLDEHLGFKQEATLSGAAPDGGDVVIYVMWKKDCRYGQ